jgi:hypothetical protein|nr:DUF2723 domain-containing protein [Kofleriaceae bacterium]
MQRALARGHVLAALALVVYCAFAPTAIVDGDNAEFASLAALGGRAHPSGYPLYVLWLRATSWLPAASAAHAAALATCVLAAALVAVLHAACRAWGARPGAASLAVAVVAASPVVLRVHTVAEVFALNGLVVATVLWLAARGGPLRGAARAAALAAVAGLGLCDHLTCALVAPVGVLGVWRGVREARRAGVAIAAAIGAFAAGLLPAVYLVVAPDSPASWGSGGGLAGVVDLVTRRDYSGSELAPGFGDAKPAANLAAFAATLARAWLWLPLAAGLAMLAWRCARRAARDAATGAQPGETRVAWLALAASWLVAGPILISRFNLDPDGFYASTVQRFHLLPMLLLAIPVAVALDAGATRAPALAGPRGGVLALAVFALFAAIGWPRIARLHSRVVEANVVDTLRAMPPDGVLITASDEAEFGAVYAQAVLGVRPDVVAITWSMTARPWYAARLAARGIAVDPQRQTQSIRAMMQHGHAVVVEDLFASVLERLPHYPFVGLVRVLPDGTPPPTVGEVAALNRDAFARFDLDHDRPGSNDGYATLVHARYARTWAEIAAAYAHAGDDASADAARAVADQLAPGDRE